MQSLVVSTNGVRLSYTDSAMPCVNGIGHRSSYITIFAIHGSGFTNAIFRRVQELSTPLNVRFVAISRRNYTDSTPLTGPEERKAILGTDTEKEEYWNERGLELLNFIDTFITRHDLPPIDNSGEGGGVAILGWSAGSALAYSAIACVDKLDPAMGCRLSLYIRGLILQDPPSVICGYRLPQKSWFPHIDHTMPPESRSPMYTRWITSYFQHGDLGTRDHEVLQWVVPALSHPPTIYNMTAEDIRKTVDEQVVDFPAYTSSSMQLAALFRKTFFDAKTRMLLPRMRLSVLTGEATCALSISGLWHIQEDNEKFGHGEPILFGIIPGANHFVHWDDPEKALMAYIHALQ